MTKEWTNCIVGVLIAVILFVGVLRLEALIGVQQNLLSAQQETNKRLDRMFDEQTRGRIR